jgi:hypothetical protein
VRRYAKVDAFEVSALRKRRGYSEHRDLQPRRRALRPLVEGLEDRRLLAAQPLVIAALGDSLTDEYEFYGADTPSPPSYPALPGAQATSLPPEIYLTGRNAARNWVMQVGAQLSSQLSFGNLTTTSRGMTRNQGYQEDWAENGTTAAGPDVSGTATTFAEEYEGIPPEFTLGFNPTPGLVTQTSPDIPIADINVVTILIGANDYNAALAAYTQQSSKLDTSVFDTANTNIENAISTAISSIQTAATAAGNTGLKFVVITTPDITVAPLIQSEAGSALPALKLIIGSKILGLDLTLAATYLGNPNVGLIDSTAIVNKFIANPVIDGVTVNMEGSGQDYTDGFIGDGFHPGTIVQGLFTQAIVNTINTLEGAQVVTPVTDTDIVNYAESSQPTISLNSSASTTTTGQAITLTAQVTPALASGATPTGTVSFEEIMAATSSQPAYPGVVLGTVPVSASRAATLTVSNLGAGTYSIAAIYNGDTNNDARLSTALSQTVTTTPAATATSLFASLNPSAPAVPITFTAIVTAPAPGLPSPTGSVVFHDQTTNVDLGTAAVGPQGVAALTAPLSATGPHAIVAVYSGTTVLATSTSAPLVEFVVAPPPPPPPDPATTTQVTAARFVSGRQVLVNLKIVVSAANRAAGFPTGSVNLGLGPRRVVALTLGQGSAQLNLPLRSVGRTYVSAYYPGTPTFAASGSPFVFINPGQLPLLTPSARPGLQFSLRAVRFVPSKTEGKRG